MNQTTIIKVGNIVASITKKDSVIFCRVSSYGQTGSFAISFEVQEHKGQVCAKLFGLKVMETVKIVESAYDGKACTIKSLINKYRGKNVIIYNVSRFSRNVNRGMELLDYALKCNTRLFFVEEGIIWDKEHRDTRDQLRDRLYVAEEESRAIAKRVKDALAEKKRRGYFTGGKPKYGYTVVDADGGRRAIPEKYEQSVIKFVNLCREVGTSVNTLNSEMKSITENFDSLIELGHNGKPINKIVEPLSYVTIADLLNSYGVKRRGSKWNSDNVSKIGRQDYENVLEGMVEMGFGFGK